MIAREIKTLFNDVDYSIINFETTIANEDDIPIEKVGSNLKTTPHIIEMLKWLGVNVVTMANNHIGDFGPKALVRACKCFEKIIFNMSVLDTIDRMQLSHYI